MNSINGKNVLITGGNSGMGFETARKFKSLGANVIITGRNPKAVDEAAEQLEVIGIVADQSSLRDIDELAVKVSQKFGHVDVLFINAGIAAFAPVEQVTEEQFDNIMNTNFKGALFTLQKFISLLRDGASVINLSSINAYTGMPNTAVYAASKAALNALTRTAATELASRKIRINSVNPGPVNTAIFGKLGMPEEAVNEFGKAMVNRIPLKRFGEPEDIANLVVFLASDEAGFITGAEYNIDGGTNVNPILS